MAAPQTVNFKLGTAEISLETGQIARQAHGAVVARQGKAFVLATLVSAATPSKADFFPLTVSYREKMAAAGRIPGNYFRRETRLGEPEILASRLIDRALRPLFAKGYRYETQIEVVVYSADPAVDLVTLGLLAAGMAAHLSDVPFEGPVAGARVLRSGSKFICGPARSSQGDIDLTLACTRGGLVMMEGCAALVPEADLLDTIEAAQDQLAPALDAMDALRELAGRAKRSAPEPAFAAGQLDALEAQHSAALAEAFAIQEKAARQTALAEIRSAALDGVDDRQIQAAFDALHKQVARTETVAGRRIGGRRADEIRPIECMIGLLPANHGSALFTRGETQALVSATLGGERDGQDIERLTGSKRERFLLHYNFPGYSVGEARPNRGPGRREIGHGHLARMALEAVMPPLDAYPYTKRVVSDITESNGSSSMATVCGGTLALLAAAVPLTAPVAGIAMGLIDHGGQTVILSDILGDEDHLGDMDFKVAGTRDGVAALQLDNKLGSLPRALLERALEQARVGRAHILDCMQPAIDALPSTPPAHVPHHARTRINQGRIGVLIGPGGKRLHQIQNKTGARLEVNQDGTVLIMGKNEAATRAALRAVHEISIELVKGGIYIANISSVKGFGAFARIADHEGLIHVSEWSKDRLETLEGLVSPGQKVLIRVLGADDRGRLKLSRKQALNASELEAING